MPTTKLNKEASNVIAKVEQANKGAWVSLIRSGKPTKKQYQLAGWCRFNRAYELEDLDDISACRYVKKGTQIYVHFNY